VPETEVYESPLALGRRLGLKLPRRDSTNQFVAVERLLDPAVEAYWSHYDRDTPDVHARKVRVLVVNGGK
jgi:hypothetical protein